MPADIAECFHLFELGLGLDALGDHFQPQFRAQRMDCTHHRGCFAGCIAVQWRDEGAIDLERLQRELMEKMRADCTDSIARMYC